ncbi:MAG TPA: hypothetical protein VGQ10_14020 [Vicinamibacterales bacterium]|jgi:DNA-binding response OmpR family regulator|nr:hypothetical protein [Vicinamibacterales bacterium]
MKRNARTVVVVSNQLDRSPVLESLANDPDCDLIVVESFANAYSSIRRLIPEMVIVCLDIDDMAAFQVLSMLTNDSAISRVRVVMHITTGQQRGQHQAVTNVDEFIPRMPLAPPAMN